MKKIFLVAVLVLFSTPALAQIDSVTTGIDVVEGFYKDSSELVKVIPFKQSDEFGKRTLENKEKTVSELKSIAISESPGPRRYRQVYRIVDSYTQGYISNVKDFSVLSQAEKTRMGEVLKKLSDLREGKLDELRKSLKSEQALEKRTWKQTPFTESSPLGIAPDKSPSGVPGPWSR